MTGVLDDTALYPPTTYYNKFDHDRVYISLDFETKSEGCSTITQAGFAVLRLNEDSRHQLLLSPNPPATTQFVHLRVAESLDYIHTNPTLQRKYNNKRGFRFGVSPSSHNKLFSVDDFLHGIYRIVRSLTCQGWRMRLMIRW